MAVHRIDDIVYIIRRKDSGNFVAGPFLTLKGLNCHITQERRYTEYSRYKELSLFEIVPYRCEEEHVICMVDHEKSRGKK